MSRTYQIEPVPAPRQVRSDTWRPSPAVVRYRQFKDEVRRLGIQVPEAGATIVFYLTMPPSWSQKKRREMAGRPHQQKPDVDNLLKALLDAIFENDCQVWDIRAIKFWSPEGMIKVHETTST